MPSHSIARTLYTRLAWHGRGHIRVLMDGVVEGKFRGGIPLHG